MWCNWLFMRFQTCSLSQLFETESKLSHFLLGKGSKTCNHNFSSFYNINFGKRNYELWEERMWSWTCLKRIDFLPCFRYRTRKHYLLNHTSMTAPSCNTGNKKPEKLYKLHRVFRISNKKNQLKFCQITKNCGFLIVF